MGENSVERYIPTPLDVHAEYASSSLNQDARFVLYDFAQPRVDPEVLLQEQLQLGGSETILDVGCGNGRTLLALRQRGHAGQLIGVDISEMPFYATTEIARETGLEPINFVVGDVHALGIGGSSVDVSTAMFMLYHCDPVPALKELKRVTRPGGTIVVATSGPLNKFLHRSFEAMLADELGYKPPPLFSTKFDSRIGDKIIPQLFSEWRKFEQRAYIDLADTPGNQAAREAFELSLLSMKGSMTPVSPTDRPAPSYAEWKAALDKVWGSLDSAVNPTREYVERDYYFCTNN